MKVIIVGGGISGLAAAYYLEQSTDCDIVLFESAAKAGGKVSTDYANGFVIEGGPDCYFALKPGTTELVEALGLQTKLIEPLKKQFSMLVGGKLHPVPSGLVSLTGADAANIDEALFVSEGGRVRAKQEPLQARGSGEDESIGSFFRRRFGEEFSQKVAEPLLAGTHGGDPCKLSMKALYPSYLNLEQRQGSLTGGPKASPPPPGGRAAFLSFQNGMAELIEGLSAALQRTKVHLGAAVNEIMPNGVQTAEGVQSADIVLAACPSRVTANLVRGPYPGLAAKLDKISFESSQILSVSFDRIQIGRDLSQTGFLVARTEGAPITGCTWSSEKWEGRAPSGKVLMRIFMERSKDETGADAMEGSAAVKGHAHAVRFVQDLLEIEGEPSLAKFRAWNGALPQYNVGHLDLMDSIDVELKGVPHLLLTGTSYRGVGLPDCINQAKEAAKQIAERS